MTTGTQVVWDTYLPQAQLQEILNKADLMASEGKTDNIPVKTQPTSIVGATLFSTVRQWTTVADAQEWIDFLAPYNPASAVIIP